MADIRFYRLTTRGVDDALPEILQKGLGAGHCIWVCVADAVEAERMAGHLWSYRAETFLPHGTKKDGHAADQPIWVGDVAGGNANTSPMVVALHGAVVETLDGVTLLCDMFDGRNEDHVAAARKRFKQYKDDGHTMTFWQQSEKGWEKIA